MSETARADPALFLSGDNGLVIGPRLRTKRTVADLAYAGLRMASLIGPRLDRLAREQQPLRILVVSVYRPGSRLPRALARIQSKKHQVAFALGSTSEPDPALAAVTVAAQMTRGKFENVNALLERAPALSGFDRLIVVDDDIDLPTRFLDRFVAICERLELDLAQPAQSMRSHAAWRVTRTRPFALARLTNFVEIGPLTMFSRRAAQALTPFPPLRFGWGLDNHWGALARDRKWRLGVIDALPVRHEWQRIASSYTHAEAIAEGSRFLAGRDFVHSQDAQRTLSTVRRLGA